MNKLEPTSNVCVGVRLDIPCAGESDLKPMDGFKKLIVFVKLVPTLDKKPPSP